MIGMLKQLFGAGPKLDIRSLRQHGAVILDVRTAAEFAAGHLDGSLNIPLDNLERRSASLPKDKPIITCCASGMRSATAKNILLRQGFTEVYNGGSWTSLKV